MFISAADELRAGGRIEGELRGKATALLRQLRRVFRTVPPDTEQRIRSASEDELDNWLDRILEADTLEGVLGRV